MASPPNFFKDLKYRFSDVKIEADGSIPTVPFLEATKQLITIFDVLGGMAFGSIKSDMMGNVQLIEDRYKTNPTRMPTLQKVLQAEKEDKISGRNATVGLLWLKRALEFVSASFQNCLKEMDQELNICFTNAYNETLKQHHSFLVKPVFSMAMSAVPLRKDFYAKLGTDVPSLLEDMKLYFSSCVTVVDTLVKYYKDNGLEK